MHLFFIICFLLFNLLTVHSQNLNWVKNFGGPGKDYGVDIHGDKRNTVFITGTMSGDAVDFDPGNDYFFLYPVNHSTDIYLARYSSAGELLWAKSIGGDTSQFVKAMAVDDTGNIYLTGRFFGGSVDFDPGPGAVILSSAGSSDAFLASYDSLGNYRWAFAFGGTLLEDCNSITIDKSGNLIITGIFTSSVVDFDPSISSLLLNALSGEMFIASYTPAGHLLWAKNTGGLNVVPRKIQADTQGNFFITGDFKGTNIDFDPSPSSAVISSNGDWDIFVASYDSAGGYRWVHGFGGTDQDVGFCLTPINGKVYIAGRFRGTNIDFDPGPDSACLSSMGLNDIYLSAYNPAGEHIWSVSIGSKGFDAVQEIVADTLGELLLFGNIGDTIDFDPGPDTALFDKSSGVYFLARFDTLGNYKQAGNFGGGLVYGAGISVNNCNEIFLTGAFEGDSADFHPDPYDTLIMKSHGLLDPFIMRFAPDPALVVSSSLSHIQCFGGSNGQIVITVNGGAPGYILKWSMGASGNSLTHLPAGYYKVTVTDTKGIQLKNGFWITQPDDLNDSVNIVHTCSGISDGSISVFLSAANPPYMLLWHTGDTSAMLTSLASGDYYLTVTDHAGCVTVLKYTVNNNPEPIADTIFGPDVAAPGDTVCLFVQARDGSTVIWHLKNGQYLSDNNDSLQVIMPEDTLRVSAYEITGEGCHGDSLHLLIPVTITGQFLYETDGIAVYPNPVRQELFIKGLQPGEYEFCLFDQTGRKLQEIKHYASTKQNVRIPMNDFASGLYLLTLISGNSHICMRFIKE